MKLDHVHCPMRKFWRPSLRLIGQNNVGISKNCTSLPRVKFCLPALCFLKGRTKCKNESFLAIRMKIHQNFSSSMTPRGLEKKRNRRLCPNFWLLQGRIQDLKRRGRRWLGGEFLGIFRGLFKEFDAKTGGRAPPPLWIRVCVMCICGIFATITILRGTNWVPCCI